MTTSAAHPSQPIRLHRHALSGHSHRVELFLALLGLPYTLVEVDLKAGAHKAPAFLAKNSFGQVPVLEDGETILADANAILVYLALKYDASARWYPTDPEAAATVQRWLSVVAGQVAFGPAAARLVNVFGAGLDHERAKAIANALLAVMDRELADRSFLAGESATIADLAAYAYLAHAPEGDVSLDDAPNVRAWLARIEALPGFVPMQKTQVGLAKAA